MHLLDERSELYRVEETGKRAARPFQETFRMIRNNSKIGGLL
jgi:hypothetical protein